MNSLKKISISCFTILLVNIVKCTADLQPYPPFLVLSSPGEPEFTSIIVKRVHDNLTLTCELRGEKKLQRYVWNYIPDDPESERAREPLQVVPSGVTLSSNLTKQDLTLKDSGQYICSAPPFSVTKYILVQERGAIPCSRGAFSCGVRCVLPVYVCDGRSDCRHGEDETAELCGSSDVCAGPDKLNCSDGRCISRASCCAPQAGALCRQPTCCPNHAGYMDDDYPKLFEDRHAPDDYGFIQSTIYTVTACALIFMIAVVLLVSAICKMHMKRAALRSHARRRFTVQVSDAHRFPPCYEASRLLERERVISARSSPAHSHRSLQQVQSCVPEIPEETLECAETPDEASGFGLSRLGAIFSSRYRQVPTQPSEVELQNVRCNSLNNSPSRSITRNQYRSPTYCDLNTDFYFTNPETEDCGRHLNYMATPVEFFRRRLDQSALERSRNLTLQLGRFQLSIPRFGRRSSTDLDRRPDTPNIAEINIDNLDFVRLNSNDTYTLNGRTIRLLGANFENYPQNMGNCPPPYNEAVRYKLYGPPPEYLSQDTLTERPANVTDDDARANIEMPPRYDDLANANRELSGNIDSIIDNIVAGISNVTAESDNVTNNGDNATNNVNNNVLDNVTEMSNDVARADSENNNDSEVDNTDNNNATSLTEIYNNLPAIDDNETATDNVSVTQ